MLVPDEHKLKAMLADLIQLEHQVGQELQYNTATDRMGDYDDDFQFLEAITTARKAVAVVLHWFDDENIG